MLVRERGPVSGERGRFSANGGRPPPPEKQSPPRERWALPQDNGRSPSVHRRSPRDSRRPPRHNGSPPQQNRRPPQPNGSSPSTVSASPSETPQKSVTPGRWPALPIIEGIAFFRLPSGTVSSSQIAAQLPRRGGQSGSRCGFSLAAHDGPPELSFAARGGG
jgi:hypothetical protein